MVEATVSKTVSRDNVGSNPTARAKVENTTKKKFEKKLQNVW